MFGLLLAFFVVVIMFVLLLLLLCLRLADSISELSLERDTWLIAEAIYSDRLGGALDDEEEGLVDMEVS